MRPITDTGWLDLHKWGVRGFNRGGRANWDGFCFGRKGQWTDCPDWDAEPECGHGFHLMTPDDRGFGFCGAQIELVEWRGEYVGLGGKAKVSSLRRMDCSEALLVEALRRCAVAVIDGDAAVSDGTAVVLTGSPKITMSEGVLYTFGTSAPVVTQSGGEVCKCGDSAPRITWIKEKDE